MSQVLLFDRVGRQTRLNASGVMLLFGIGDAVVFRKPITGYDTDENGRIVVHFTDGDNATADVLIGADRINSIVRQRKNIRTPADSL
ncbi:hypothetical protein [Nocardia sp. NPDC049707]|uniref:hypothetical protein n=1 Tax=Nocardia sp. NPDC049707 TaxID=3154735 RepID=UPI00342B9971